MRFLSVLFCVINFFAFSQSNIVQQKLDRFAALPALQNAGISFQAINLADGSVIASHNPKMAMAPASTVKLFTTATAFQILGAYYRPKTRFYLDGNLDTNGILNGNLVIRGGGDPALGSRFFEKRGTESEFLYDWVSQLQSLGIKEIKGAVITDGSDFGYNGAPAGWTWGDMGNYYGAGPAGCTLYDNMVYLLFNTGKEVGDSTTFDCTIPYIPNYELQNYVTSGTSKLDNSYVYGAPYLEKRFIKGSLPVNSEGFEVKGSIPDPEYLMAVELSYALQNSGVSISNAPEGNLTYRKRADLSEVYKQEPFYTFKGKSLSAVAYHTNMRSVNLFAEQILCLIGYEKYNSGSTSSGAAYVNYYWRQKVGSGLNITDGSGLSRNNSVSAHHYTAMLKYMHTSENAEALKKTLPVAGKSGTLSRVCRGQTAHGRLIAKSGTMTRIKSYAGYVNSKSGKKIAFAIIVNNYTGKTSSLVKQMEYIFNAMATY